MKFHLTGPLAALLLLTSCSERFHVHESPSFKTHTFRFAYANVHVIEDEQQNFLLSDAGLYEKAQDLEESMIERGLDPSRIKGIVISHGHYDHVAGAKYFQEKYSTPVLAGLGDKDIINQGRARKLCPTNSYARWIKEREENRVFAPPKVDHWIDKEMPLNELIGFEGTVTPIPSHTPGSLGVVIGKNAYVGDLLRGGVFTFSPEVHFYMCDLDENTRYIRAFLERFTNIKNVFPGHFGPKFSRQEVLHFFERSNLKD